MPTNSRDGKSFHSKLEAGRYEELVLLQRAGKIKNLQTQVTFRLDVNGDHICNYIADFTYETEHGKEVVEDTKGVVTPEFQLKKKLMKACLGIEIELVFAKARFPKKWSYPYVEDAQAKALIAKTISDAIRDVEMKVAEVLAATPQAPQSPLSPPSAPIPAENTNESTASGEGETGEVAK